MRTLFLLLGVALVLTFSSATAFARKPLPRSLPLEAMIGQMLMVGFTGDGTAPKNRNLQNILEDIRAGRIGGVILFDLDWQTKKRGRNIVSTSQVKALTTLLQKNAPVPLFIAVDQEGGRVQRLREGHGFSETPSAESLGKGTSKATYQTAQKLGKGLRDLGITVNFAPVADIATTADSPAIGRLERAFGADPTTVAEHAAAFAKGLAENGVASCYKHFPGHGSARADSHHTLTDITKTWSEAELLPYTPKHLPQGIPLMVMTGHLVHAALDPEHPATLSEAVTTGLLREKLGWQGVIVTDDLEMNAVHAFYSMEKRIALAVNAGADIILFGNNLQYHPEQGRRIHAILTQLVADGIISQERIVASWQRIRHLKEQLLP